MPAFRRFYWRVSALPVLLVVLALLSGCTGNPFENDKAKGDTADDDSTFILAQNLLEGTAQAASDLHQDVAADDRVQARMASSAEDTVKADASGNRIGEPKGNPELSKGNRPKPSAANALLKSATASLPGGPLLAKRAAGDSIRLVISDSARGRVYALRTYAFAETADAPGEVRTGAGRDSTVLRWPHDPGNPVVLAFHRERRFDDGAVETSSALDDDGDGILGEAPTGKSVRLRRDWIVTAGDTARRSTAFTDHGQTAAFENLGAGKARSWSDTLIAGGKVAWWRRVFDADGDGFVHTAAAGGKVKIGNDTYFALADDLFRYGFETHGPGPDGDYGKGGDNELYAASSMLVNAKGEDVSRTASGDADGDGLLWSAAAGAENRVWETTEWLKREGYRSYRDSVVRLAGAGREEQGKVAFHQAKAVRSDGSSTTVSMASVDGKTPFGGSDEAVATERTVFAPGDAERRDSTVRTAILIPGRFGDDADDRLLAWSVKTWFNAGSALQYRTESFTAAEPVARGAEAKAGSRVVEERRRGAEPGEIVRTWRRHDFDRVAGTGEWKEVRTRKDGDSSVTRGRKDSKDGGTWVTHSGKGLRQSGWFNAATGAFKDTMAWVDAEGKDAGRRTGEGVWKSGLGEYAVTLTRKDGKTVESG